MPIQSKQQPPYYQEGINTKKYIANIIQTGTTPPSATLMKNTIGEPLIWTRAGVGTYLITTTENRFPELKTTVQLPPLNQGFIYYTWADEQTLEISTRDLTGNLSDDYIGGYTTIEINVFP